MKHALKAWLVAYDIKAPRRLKRVHRFLEKRGVAAQYSAFIVEADDVGIGHLLGHLRGLIDLAHDDVRAYHVPQACTVWSLGCQQWPDGICLTGTQAARLLLAPAATGSEPAAAPPLNANHAEKTST